MENQEFTDKYLHQVIMVKGSAVKLNAVTPKTPDQTHYFRPFGSLRSSARTSSGTHSIEQGLL